MRILVSGSSGFIGRSLVPFLRERGHEVLRLVRSKKQRAEDTVVWNPETGEYDKTRFEGFDAVVHLAGANIVSLWTENQKKRLFTSRCRDTWLLSQILTRLKNPPKVFIVASACGYYGSRGDEKLTEQSPQGEGFLADLCAAWEEATRTVEQQGKTRVVHARLGVVLSTKGGMLARLIPVYKFCLGGRWGSGQQFLPWIALEDVLGALHYLLLKEELRGPVNLSAPHPVRQAEFSNTLAKHLHRPAPFPLPAFLLCLFLGRAADELLLASQNVHPQRLLSAGYAFRHPTLESVIS